MRLTKAAAGAAAFLFTAAVACDRPEPVPPAETAEAVSPARPHEPVFDTAAALAWRQFEQLYTPRTGLARATRGYDKLTPWDIGSVLAGLHSARVLGLLSEEQYRARMTRTLRTLEAAPLFRGVFHKLYHAPTARLVGKGGRPSSQGYAYSATDLGRLLIWLRIVAESDTALAARARRVAHRVDLGRVVEAGYLHGEELSPRRRSGVRRFQEGRIGYEQYAARGFALWGEDAGASVAPAMSLESNAAPLVLDGIELLRDRRGLDRLTSEPLILLGIELGWTPAESLLATNVLRVQEARWRRTKQVTVVSEDAVGIPPHYFYYYCVYCSGKAFVVETWDPGTTRETPRWVSTKAAFAWHALLPGEYTRLALDHVRAARGRDGWASGVMEQTGRPTPGFDINTAAVILEAAAYHRLGRPLLPSAASANAE